MDRVEYSLSFSHLLIIFLLLKKIVWLLLFLKIFEKNSEGSFQYHGDHQPLWKDDHFKEHHLFYEFFHGDTGQGLGASHQTGWTALIANLLLEMDE
jgi:hypothetical protein